MKGKELACGFLNIDRRWGWGEELGFQMGYGQGGNGLMQAHGMNLDT